MAGDIGRRPVLNRLRSDLPQSVISEHLIKHPKTLAKQGVSGQNKEK